MMTVAEAEAELMRQAADKGRSASFCAPGQPPLTLSAAHSSQELCDMSVGGRAHAQVAALALLTEQQQEENMGHLPPANQSPRARLKVSHGARRSQSCRVQGSRPPIGKRRESRDSPSSFRGSGANLNVLDRDDFFENAQAGGGSRRSSASYDTFMKKVPSCGRLVTLSTDPDSDDFQGSPILRRTASARRALPPTSSPNHSPTPTRVGARPTGGTQKGRNQSRKGTSGSTRRPAGTGYLDVKPNAGSAETLDPEAYLLRNFSTTNKGKYFKLNLAKINHRKLVLIYF